MQAKHAGDLSFRFLVYFTNATTGVSSLQIETKRHETSGTFNVETAWPRLCVRYLAIVSNCHGKQRGRKEKKKKKNVWEEMRDLSGK